MSNACPSIAELTSMDRAQASLVEAHLAECAPCRAIAELVAGRPTPDPGPPTEACAAVEPLIAAGPALSPAEAIRLDRHLRACPTCRAVARTLAPDQELAAPGAALPPVPPEAYQVGAELARGGMGRVRVAWDRRIGRPVALKELLDPRPGRIGRFEREARVTARLQHPGIVPIYEVGRWPSGEPFYAMKIVPGRSLDEVIGAAQTTAHRLDLIRDVIAVAEAVAYAHSKRIIHRDLKPANVIVGAFGETVVIDWGLAKDLGANEPDEPSPPTHVDEATPAQINAATPAQETDVGTVVGTATYMPPEQANGRPVDERADVYALGAILYHVLSGTAPYRGSSQEILAQLRAGRPPAPLDTTRPWRWHRVEARVSEDLRSVVEKAMAHDPAARYANAGELVDELKRYQNGQLVLAHDYSLAALVRRFGARHRAVLAASGVLFLALLVTAGVSVQRTVQARRAAEVAQKDAVSEELQARRTAATLLEEQGRTRLLGGSPVVALAYLAEAYRSGNESPSVRFLVAAAARDVEALAGSLGDGGAPIVDVAFDAAGQRAITVSDAVRIWSVPEGTLRLTVANGAGATGARFSPDGGRLVTWGDEPAARLWDARDGRPLAVLGGHVGSLSSAEIAGDGRVLTVGSDGRALVHGEAGALQATIEATAGDSLAFNLRGRFSPDGRQVLTWSDDGVVALWDASSGLLRTLIRAHVGAIPAATFSRDGRRLITSGVDGRARVWDAGSGRLVAELTGHQGSVVDALLLDDGRRAVTASLDMSARVWDVESGALLASLAHGAPVVRVAASANGATLVTAGDDGIARLWSSTDGVALATWEAHQGRLSFAAFAPGDRLVLTAGRDGRAHLWRADAGKRRFVLEGFRNVEFTPAGDRLVATSGQDHERVSLFRLADGSRLVTNEAMPAALLGPRPFDPAAEWVVVEVDGHAVVADAGSARIRAPLADAGRLDDVYVSPTGDRIVGTMRQQPPVLWDAGGRRVATLLAHAGGVRVRFAKGGRRFLTVGDDDAPRVWDAAAGRRVATLEGAAGPLGDLALTADGTLAVAAGEEDRVARVWDATTGRILLEVPRALGASLSADGKSLAVAHEDGGATVWEIKDRALRQRLAADATRCWSAAFSPDGHLLVTSGSDGSAKIWDRHGGQLLATFEGHFAEAGAAWQAPAPKRWRALFGPDGEHVLTVGPGPRAAVWDARQERRTPLEIARLLAQRVPYRIVDGRLVGR